MLILKGQKLKTVYYKSFLCFIVIPILLVAIGTFAIVKKMMLDTAIRNIEKAQASLIATIEGEIKDASLRLSHFLYVNDNKITEIAAKTDTVDIPLKNEYVRELTSLFNFAMCPLEDIVSASFFMKNGNHTCIKEDYVIPVEEIKNSQWYQETLKQKDQVMVGSFNKRLTPSKYGQHPFYIAVGMSPDTRTDRSGKIEAAVLILISQTQKIVKHIKEPQVGQMVILDSKNQVIYDISDGKLEVNQELLEVGQYQYRKADGKKYLSVVSVMPTTGWKVVNVVSYDIVTGDFNKTAAFMLIIITMLFLLFYVFMTYFLRNIIHPVNAIIQGFGIAQTGNLEVFVEPCGQSEIQNMIHSFNHMIGQLNILIRENAMREKKKQEAEMKVLQSQINPHFLVNSLNSIRFMAQISRFDGIRKMAEALIKILSCSFRSNIELYTVREELEVLDSFVFLMSIRYSDGFEFVKRIEKDCEEVKIPRLILQPIIENSIVHAFTGFEDKVGVITLTIKREENWIYFRIEDNGKGMTAEAVEQVMQPMEDSNENIGVRNVFTRLKLHYGERCNCSMESELGQYTRTTLAIHLMEGE